MLRMYSNERLVAAAMFSRSIALLHGFDLNNLPSRCTGMRLRERPAREDYCTERLVLKCSK